MIRFILLMLFSTVLVADELEDCLNKSLAIQCIELTWDHAEFREDGTAIEERERYNLYHYYENILQDTITIDPNSTKYLAFDVGIGRHAYQISTVEDGVEGRRSDPIFVSISAVAVSPPGKITISGNNLSIRVID
jgi:hypothetical protein